MDRKDPGQFKPKPKRSPQVIAKEILEFVIDQHPSLKHPIDPEMPTQFGVAVDELISDVLMDTDVKDPDRMTQQLLKRSDDLEQMIQLLEHLKRGGNVPATARAILPKAPELLELLAKHWDSLAEQGDAGGIIIEHIKGMLPDDDMPGLTHDPSHKDTVDGDREMRWSAQNIRMNIASLFEELSNTLGIGGADSSMGHAFD